MKDEAVTALSRRCWKTVTLQLLALQWTEFVPSIWSNEAIPTMFLLYSVTPVWVKVMETLSRWPSSFSCQCKCVLTLHRADGGTEGDFLNVNWIYNLKVPDVPNQVSWLSFMQSIFLNEWKSHSGKLSCLDVPQAPNPCFFRCLEEGWAGVEAVTVDNATPSQTVFVHHWCNPIKRKTFDFPVYSLKSVVHKIF